eukprot:3211333-Prymnesium_polylepis.1
MGARNGSSFPATSYPPWQRDPRRGCAAGWWRELPRRKVPPTGIPFIVCRRTVNRNTTEPRFSRVSHRPLTE